MKLKDNINITPIASSIWKKLQMGEDLKSLVFEIEKHNEFFKFFQVGEYYYFVVNLVESCFEHVSDGVTSLLGYNPKTLTLPVFLDKIHPEDKPWFLNFESKVIDFFGMLNPEQIPNYKVRYDYRVRHKEGHYIRILQQVVTLSYSNEGGLFRTLVLHTDISHLKKEGSPVLSFIGLNDEPSYIDIKANEVFNYSNNSPLTSREKDVVILLIEGYSTKNIAEKLKISRETVSTHRKKILQKTEALNTADLVSKSILKGWI
jgi:DNA-binding CsgD family transcriptional regulator